MTAEEIRLDRGAFVLSLDFELIWGTLDIAGAAGFRRQCEIERTEVVEQLLELFIEFEIPATWLVVGHLLLERCDAVNGVRHPEIVRPRHAWCSADWFARDPGGDEIDAPLFFGRSLVEKIRRCPVPQEIGSHSFSHVIFGDPGCSAATARSELEACSRAAQEIRIDLRSFSFPRNDVGHQGLLKEYGFTCFRGPEPRWYQAPTVPSVIRRLGHLCDVLAARRPPAVLPRRTKDGLIDIPGSMVYFPAHGPRRFLPMAWRVNRALRGIDLAAQTRRVFHLWMHPTNMADSPDKMFEGLRRILEWAVALRTRGVLETVSMGTLASRLNAVTTP